MFVKCKTNCSLGYSPNMELLDLLLLSSGKSLFYSILRLNCWLYSANKCKNPVKNFMALIKNIQFTSTRYDV
jgi:hypothetical protein